MGSERNPKATPDLLVQKALRLFREHPERRWTVEEVARAVGTSRPVLARRFADALGISPLRSLRDSRMKRAAELLVSTEDKLAAIADRVGYESEFAFSRAFFRHHGTRPGTFRRLHRSVTGPVALAA